MDGRSPPTPAFPPVLPVLPSSKWTAVEQHLIDEYDAAEIAAAALGYDPYSQS